MKRLLDAVVAEREELEALLAPLLKRREILDQIEALARAQARVEDAGREQAPGSSDPAALVTSTPEALDSPYNVSESTTPAPADEPEVVTEQPAAVDPLRPRGDVDGHYLEGMSPPEWVEVPALASPPDPNPEPPAEPGRASEQASGPQQVDVDARVLGHIIAHGPATMAELLVALPWHRQTVRCSLRRLRQDGKLEQIEGTHRLPERRLPAEPRSQPAGAEQRQQAVYEYIAAHEGCRVGDVRRALGMTERVLRTSLEGLTESLRIRREGVTSASRYWTTAYLDRQEAEREAAAKSQRRGPQSFSSLADWILGRLNGGGLALTEEEIAEQAERSREDVALATGELFEANLVHLTADGHWTTMGGGRDEQDEDSEGS